MPRFPHWHNLDPGQILHRNSFDRPSRQVYSRRRDLNRLRRPMAKPFPLNPKNPERICWGCDQYCPPDAMRCGNGSERTQHPVELFGEGWNDWGLAAADQQEAEKKP